ncbi:MAG: hypothetical protein J5I93_26275, partial [Pirellulaceae bacterium]|nr:hypothetical protein [Pirellulaceae bacterium]
MQTFKTAVVVILLLALLYGVYVVLSKPEAQEAASELARELVPAARTPRDPAPDDTLQNPWVSLPGDAQSGPTPLGSSGGPGPAIHMSHAQPPADWPAPESSHLAHSAHSSSGDSRPESAGPAREIQPATAESYLPGAAAPLGPIAQDRGGQDRGAARPTDRDSFAPPA